MDGVLESIVEIEEDGELKEAKVIFCVFDGKSSN
jgi:hypothetical protein